MPARRARSRLAAPRRVSLAVGALLLAGCASYPGAGFGTATRPVSVVDTPFVPQQRYQCGPAALQTVLLQSGVDSQLEELVDRVYVPGHKGSFQAEIVSAARSASRLPYRIDGSLEAIGGELSAGRPVLVLQNLGLSWYPRWHFAVVYRIDPDEGTVWLRSGTERERETDARVFLRTWARSGFWAIVTLRPGELPTDPDPDRYFAAVIDLESTGQLAAAGTAWAAAAARWPDRAMPLFGMANVAYANGQPAVAEAYYRQLLSREPAHAMARNNLAWTLADTGRTDEALAELRRALAEPDLTPELRAEIEDSLATISKRTSR